jgi:hypothetical protein
MPSARLAWGFAGLLVAGCAVPLDPDDAPPSPPAPAAGIELPTYNSQRADIAGVIISVESCDGGPASCAFVTRPGQQRVPIALSPGPATALEIGSAGPHFGGRPAVYIYWFNPDDERSNISVLDLDRMAAVGWVGSPSSDALRYTVHDTYFSVVHDPAGLAYPFLAPGARYLNKPHWSQLCIFDPTRISDPDPPCGTGFVHRDVAFAGDLQNAQFRHNGGWVQDIDGDGWDDIHLPFLGHILSLSGRTGAQLALSQFDVARFSEPDSLVNFHSGRLYGSFTAFSHPTTGASMVYVSAGTPVGQFADPYCNVSRYQAALRWAGAAQLTWSNYLSFAKTIFRPPYQSIDDVLRRGQMLDECVHRFSDSLVWPTAKQPVGVYSHFSQTVPPDDDCQAQILAEQRSGFQQSDADATTACAAAHWVTARGRWTIQALDAVTGGGVIAWPDAYAWGRVANLVPGQPHSLVVQTFSQPVELARTAEAPQELRFVSLLGPDLRWVHHGRLAAPGAAPKTDHVTGFYGSRRAGLGHTAGGIPELVTADVDADGLRDVALEDGSWVGYSLALDAMVIKHQ